MDHVFTVSDLSPRYMPEGWSLPAITSENRAFFTSCTVALQQCAKCRNIQHPPEELCRSCGSFDFEYVEAAARGVIQSFTIVHHPMHPLLEEKVPYNVVIVSLESHPHVRIVGNVIDLEPGEVQIGLQVQATWAEVPSAGKGEEMLYLPQWKVRR